MDVQRITKSEILRKVSKEIRGQADSAYDHKEDSHLVFIDSVLKKFTGNNGKKLLDVGCGHGRFLREAKKRGFDVEGTEIDDYAIEQNRKEGLKCIKSSLSEVLPYSSNSFDGVFCHGVLEHINEVDVLFIAFHEFHRILRPGGLLIVGVPYGLPKTFYNHPAHFRPFNPHTLCSLADLNKFKKFKTYVYYSDWLIQHNIPLIKMLNKLTKIEPLSKIISKIMDRFFGINRDTLMLEAVK